MNTQGDTGRELMVVILPTMYTKFAHNYMSSQVSTHHCIGRLLYQHNTHGPVTMGVNGLWQVLEPASRPTNVQHLAHKVVSVDISIWLYQLVRGMRGPDGQMLHNAHLQGCFTRICDLLKHEVRPIFVFDGAAPMLKQHALVSCRRVLYS